MTPFSPAAIGYCQETAGGVGARAPLANDLPQIWRQSRSEKCLNIGEEEEEEEESSEWWSGVCGQPTHLEDDSAEILNF